MGKDIIIMNAIILFYIIQRVSEMVISQNNEKLLKKNFQAIEVDKKESLRMRIFHTLWFISLLIESNVRHNLQSDEVSAIIYIVLGLCLAIRFHTMEKLKQFWTIKVLSLDYQKIITSGLYNYIRHPNYLVVVLEFIFIPLLFKAYITLAVFSILNIFILKKRIALEEEALMSHHGYKVYSAEKKRFLPYLFIFLVSFNLRAEEVNYHFANYSEAKDAKNFVKFESKSTKLGFITTGFDGYAKDIKIEYLNKANELTGLSVTIPVRGLDTDNSSRDEKMHQQIMDAEKFPVIHIVANDKITLEEGSYNKDMIFTIKDKKTIRPVKFDIKKDGKKVIVTGSASLGLAETGLPDPSIAIAKVRDLFDLKFSVELTQ